MEHENFLANENTIFLNLKSYKTELLKIKITNIKDFNWYCFISIGLEYSQQMFCKMKVFIVIYWLVTKVK